MMKPYTSHAFIIKQLRPLHWYIRYARLCVGVCVQSRMHHCACHDCVYKCRRHGGERICLIAFATSWISPVLGSRQSTGGPTSWVLNGRLSKQTCLTCSLGPVVGDERICLLPLQPCSHAHTHMSLHIQEAEQCWIYFTL